MKLLFFEVELGFSWSYLSLVVLTEFYRVSVVITRSHDLCMSAKTHNSVLPNSLPHMIRIDLNEQLVPNRIAFPSYFISRSSFTWVYRAVNEIFVFCLD